MLPLKGVGRDRERLTDSIGAVVGPASMQRLHRMAERLELMLREAQAIRDRAERTLARSRERDRLLWPSRPSRAT